MHLKHVIIKHKQLISKEFPLKLFLFQFLIFLDSSVVKPKDKLINTIKEPFKRYFKTGSSLRKNRTSLHGSQVTMPHDIDTGAGALKSALRRRSKYDEELSIEENNVEETVSDDSDKEADHEEIELIESVDHHGNTEDFVDWDDVNDPEYIEVNTSNSYMDEVDGTGEQKSSEIKFLHIEN